MTQAFPQNGDILIRPLQYGDLEAAERFCADSEDNDLSYYIHPDSHLKPLHAWYGPMRLLGMLINRPHVVGAYLPDRDEKLQGIIQISPFNHTRSTWRVDRVAMAGTPTQIQEPITSNSEFGDKSGNNSGDKMIAEDVLVSAPVQQPISFGDVGSLLLRYCFETIWEARTWLLEVNINDKDLIALYQQNGFQRLAEMTYWEISPDQLQELAEREPDLPNLLPISNADSHLLYQLDTMSMPPLLRQVFDRHVADFKTSLFGSVMQGVKNWLNRAEVVSGYVFEPQRKAAIGYFHVQLCRDGSHPHHAQLTVNPAYTWLYPELMSQMARIITKDFPAQSLQLASADYQQEREEYLESIGTSRVAHTLMMSRSVWHKVRESKLGLENLQLPEMLQGLKPSRKAVPSRISVMKPAEITKTDNPVNPSSPASRAAKSVLNLSSKTDFSEPPQEGPCC